MPKCTLSGVMYPLVDAMAQVALPNNIRAEMARHRRTHQQVAKAAGISREALRRRLYGDTAFRIDEIHKIADYLDVAVSALLEDGSAV